MSFGTPGGPTHPWVIPEADSEPFFKLAVEQGINFFDTADHYNFGESEEITGRMLKKYARRDEIVLATKVGLITGHGPNKKGLSRKHILEGVDASLKRLQMDHVDLLYVHRLDPNTPYEETLEALDTVVRAGKVIYPAASSMWAWQFAKLREMQIAAGFRTLCGNAESLQSCLSGRRAGNDALLPKRRGCCGAVEPDRPGVSRWQQTAAGRRYKPGKNRPCWRVIWQ